MELFQIIVRLKPLHLIPNTLLIICHVGKRTGMNVLGYVTYTYIYDDNDDDVWLLCAS